MLYASGRKIHFQRNRCRVDESHRFAECAQGTAADLIKLAMIAIDARLEREKFEAKMILQVHDELLFEAPEKETQALTELVRDEMENVYKLAVPLVVEIGVGANWRDLE